jgi:beta-glucosidase
MAPGGDRVSLWLAETDEALIAAAASQHPRVIVVVVAGSAVVMPWVDTVSATLVTWYSGVEGGAALADIVTGRSEPGGRLPFAVPTDPDHLVDFDRTATAVVYDLFHGQWKLDRDGAAAHFPFGWGLGYGAPRLEAAEATDAHTVRVTVSNDGGSPTSVVVFAFGGLDASAHERPRRRLVGFARTVLGAGASETLDVDLDWSALDLHLDGTWVTEPGRYVIEIGLHAHDPDSISLPVDRG